MECSETEIGKILNHTSSTVISKIQISKCLLGIIKPTISRMAPTTQLQQCQRSIGITPRPQHRNRTKTPTTSLTAGWYNDTRFTIVGCLVPSQPVGKRETESRKPVPRSDTYNRAEALRPYLLPLRDFGFVILSWCRPPSRKTLSE